ncbi:hypothetical protein KIPB_011067, partial [Kipferlia bialata]|eukprot:g11067.t1
MSSPQWVCGSGVSGWLFNPDGVFDHIVSKIFDTLSLSPITSVYTVAMSAFEVPDSGGRKPRERFAEMRDLLSPDNPISPSRPSCIAVQCTSPEHCVSLLTTAQSNSANFCRASDSTQSEAEYLPVPASSHMFVRISVHNSGTDTLSCLHIVDPVGSKHLERERGREKRDGRMRVPDSPVIGKGSSDVAALYRAMHSLAIEPGSYPTARDCPLTQLLVPLLVQASVQGLGVVTGGRGTASVLGTLSEVHDRASSHMVSVPASKDQLILTPIESILGRGVLSQIDTTENWSQLEDRVQQDTRDRQMEREVEAYRELSMSSAVS